MSKRDSRASKYRARMTDKILARKDAQAATKFVFEQAMACSEGEVDDVAANALRLVVELVLPSPLLGFDLNEATTVNEMAEVIREIKYQGTATSVESKQTISSMIDGNLATHRQLLIACAGMDDDELEMAANRFAEKNRKLLRKKGVSPVDLFKELREQGKDLISHRGDNQSIVNEFDSLKDGLADRD